MTVDEGDDFAVNFVGGRTVKLKITRQHLDVIAGGRHGLASITRLKLGQFFFMVQNLLRNLDQQSSFVGGVQHCFVELAPLDTINAMVFWALDGADWFWTALLLSPFQCFLSVEYLYEWIIDIEEPELRITHITTGNAIKFKIKDLPKHLFLGFQLPQN